MDYGLTLAIYSFCIWTGPKVNGQQDHTIHCTNERAGSCRMKVKDRRFDGLQSPWRLPVWQVSAQLRCIMGQRHGRHAESRRIIILGTSIKCLAFFIEVFLLAFVAYFKSLFVYNFQLFLGLFLYCSLKNCWDNPAVQNYSCKQSWCHRRRRPDFFPRVCSTGTKTERRSWEMTGDGAVSVTP